MDEEAQQAFEHLTQAMATTPVLALPDFNKPFLIETDACDQGVGAVLMLRDRPVAFFNKALTEQHKHLSIYEKEFLALIMAVDKWRQYLQNQEFVIRTYHKSLTYLMEQNLHSNMQKTAMSRMMGLKFRLEYRKGKENVAADALSRMNHLCAIQAVSVPQPTCIQELLNSYSTDVRAQELITKLTISEYEISGSTMDKGFIRYKGRLWVAQNSILQTKIIASLHSSTIGQSGSQATYQRVDKLFYWKGMKQSVEDFVRQCGLCQQAKRASSHTHRIAKV